MVLVVDDDEDIRQSIMEILVDEGYDVRAASNGLETMAMLKTLRPGLILLDWMMPGLDGAGVLQALKADPELAEIPVVILSASHHVANGSVRHVRKRSAWRI